MSDENGKTIKFKFEIDQQSFNSVKQAIESLGQSFSKINAAAGGLMGGGGLANISVGGQSPGKQQLVQAAAAKTQGSSQVSGPSMTKVILDNASAFKKFAAEGKESSKIMTDALKRDLTEQERSLDELQLKLKNLSEEYQAATKAQKDFLNAGKTGQAAAMGAHATNISNQISATSGQVLQTNNQLANAQQLIGGGFGGFMQAVGYGGSGFGGGYLGALRGLGTSAAGAFMVANFAADQSLAGERSINTAGAQRGDLIRNSMRKLVAGDYKDLFFADGDPEFKKLFKKEATKGVDYAKEISLKNAVLSAIAPPLALGGLAGQFKESYDSGNLARDFKGLGRGLGQLAGEVPILGSLLRAGGIVGPDVGGGAFGGFTTAAQADAQTAQAQATIDNNRRAQVLAEMSIDKYQGQRGLSMQAQRIMGMSGFGLDKHGMPINSVARLDDKLMAQGYNTSELISATSQLIGGGGRKFASQNAYQLMAAAASGLGGFGELLGSSARSGAGTSLAYGALGGKIGDQAGVALGSAIAQGGFDPRGTTSGLGVLAAVQSGFSFDGQATDFNQVQRIQQGLRVGDAITGGSLDGYQRGRNVVGAQRVLGGGASTYAIDYLANGMTMKQRLDASRGELTNSAKAIGLTSDQIKAATSDQLGSVLGRFFVQNTNDPASRAVAKFRASRKSLDEFVKGANSEDKSALMGAYNFAMGGKEEEGVAGLFGLVEGFGAKDFKKGGVGRKLTGLEADDAQAQAEKQKRITAEMERNFGKLSEKVAASTGSFDKLKTFSENLGASAEDFIKAMKDTTTVMKTFVDKVGAQVGFKRTP